MHAAAHRPLPAETVNPMAPVAPGLPAGRTRRPDWRGFQRPAEWREACWFATRHAASRCAERGVPAQAVIAALRLADLCIPGGDGALRLTCSRKALRRARHDAQAAASVRILARLVLVVSFDGAVITAWLDVPRRVHPQAACNDDRFDLDAQDAA